MFIESNLSFSLGGGFVLIISIVRVLGKCFYLFVNREGKGGYDIRMDGCQDGASREL